MLYRSRFYWRLGCVLLLFVSTALADPIPFRRAIELALKRSGTMAIAQAEQRRTYESYLQVKYGFLPQVVLGSGIGYSYGIPLTIEGTAPSLFNINSQQFLLNFAQRAFMKAAKADWTASELDMLDKKNAVILDTAVAYAQLDSANEKLRILRDAEKAADRAQFITSERLKEGIDSELDLKKAKLDLARIRLRMAQAEADADVLRDKLSKLIGIPADSIETVTESVPETPEIPQDKNVAEKSAAENPAVKVAFQKAMSAELRAQGEHKQLLPSLDLGGQYAFLSTYNNYDQVYRNFQRNNFTFGVNIRFPIFNPSQKAAARAADADAVKAKKQAEQVQNDLESQTLGQLRGLRQLAAARDVAKLEYEIAQTGIDAAQEKLQTGEAGERDVELARLDSNDKYAAYIDASFDLYKAEMVVLRSTGKIQEWALGQQ